MQDNEYDRANTSDNIGVQCFVHRIKGLISCGSMSCKLSKRNRLWQINLKKKGTLFTVLYFFS